MSMKLKSICEMRSTSIIKCVWVIRQYPILDPKWVEKKKLSSHIPNLTFKLNAFPEHSTKWLISVFYERSALHVRRFVHQFAQQKKKWRYVNTFNYSISLHLDSLRLICNILILTVRLMQCSFIFILTYFTLVQYIAPLHVSLLLLMLHSRTTWYWKVTFSTRLWQVYFTSLNPCFATMFQGWCGCVSSVSVSHQWCEEGVWRILQGVQGSIPEVGTLHRCCPCPTSRIGKKLYEWYWHTRYMTCNKYKYFQITSGKQERRVFLN